MSTLLSINNYYYYRGGAETVFLEQNRILEGQGWKVVPFGMQHPKNLPTPWSKFFIDEIEFGQDYSLARKIVSASKVIYSFEAKRKLATLLDQVQPDIAHGHNIYHHLSPSILSTLKNRGIPTVLTLHDLKIACPAYAMLAPDGICERCKGGRLHNVLVHRCIKNSAVVSGVVMLEAMLHSMLGTYRNCVSRFVVPSRFYIDKLVEWGMPRTMFKHVPNFADTSRLRPQYAPGKPFLYFGRISREKGIATLIQAVALAKSSLLVAGTGPQLDEMRALAAQLSADVTFLGYQTGEALHDVVRSARAIVLPSEWYENAPMSVLEAYGMGKPVIGANIGGLPELIRDGETGFIYPSGDRQALAATLLKMSGLGDDAKSDAQIEAMGRAGRQWVETEFTAEMYRDRLLDIYRELGVGAIAAQAPIQA